MQHTLRKLLFTGFLFIAADSMEAEIPSADSICNAVNAVVSSHPVFYSTP
jgi:hypothetical protein